MSTPAKPAATLVLLRDHPDGYEIFMAQRAATMAFAGGMMAFPGGKVDDSDATVPGDSAIAQGFEGLDTVDAAARVAAVRETFEEAGVLLSDGPAVADDVRDAWRKRIVAHEAGFGDFLHAVGHRLDARVLTPYAHWCPPENLDQRRYDTRFYVAVMPAAESAGHDGGESVESHWVTPAGALARADRGETMLLFPTRCNVERLAQHPTVPALMAHIAAHPVRMIQPSVAMKDGEPWLTIPADAGYPVTSAPLNGLRRG